MFYGKFADDGDNLVNNPNIYNVEGDNLVNNPNIYNVDGDNLVNNPNIYNVDVRQPSEQPKHI